MESSRASVLWQIAELYPLLVDPLNGKAGIPGTGETWGGMPATYTPTVKEFERLVVEMRECDSQIKTLRWHLLEWHLKARTVIRHEPCFVKTRGPKRRYLLDQDGNRVTRPVIRWQRNTKASEQEARRAVEWIAERWGLPSEPMLPKAVVSA